MKGDGGGDKGAAVEAGAVVEEEEGDGKAERFGYKNADTVVEGVGEEGGRWMEKE